MSYRKYFFNSLVSLKKVLMKLKISGCIKSMALTALSLLISIVFVAFPERNTLAFYAGRRIRPGYMIYCKNFTANLGIFVAP